MTSKTVAIIPNYNGKQFLEPCIEALLAQNPAPLEIVVVDNCSADGSVELLKSRYPDVRIITIDHNAGFGAAVNRGIIETAGQGEYVALVNNDAVVQPGWLATLESFMDADKAVGASTPKVIFNTEGNIIDAVGDECTAYGFVRKRGHFEEDRGQYDEVAEVFSVSAVATLFRRDMFDRIGLFDENMFAYYEDVEICFRARLAGYNFFCVPTAVSLHRYSATSGRQVKLGYEEVYIHLTGMWLKTVPGAIILRHLPSVLLYHSAIAGGVLLARIRGQARLPKVSVMKFLKAMMVQRRAVQKLRIVPVAEIEKRLLKVNVVAAISSRVMKALRRVKQ